MAFEGTAQLLATVIGRMSEEGWRLDMEHGGLFDTTLRPGEQQIATPNQTMWLIDWLTAETKKESRNPDGVGFEPTVRVNARRFSRPLP
jgi:hypothetical protein